MQFWRREWPFWVLLVGSFLMAALAWSRVPERIPVHWGIDGTPDRYGGRAEGLLLFPILSLLIYGLLLVAPRLDPKRVNYANFVGPYTVLRFAIMVFLVALQGFTILNSLGYPLSINRVVPLMVGILFIVLGALMGKLRPTWFVGIRTPWTISSDRVWGKTHRLGGWIFIIMGALFILAGLVNTPAMTILSFIGAVLGVTIMILYSYLIWRQEQPEQPTHA